jgi:hypothetical protein
LTVPCKLAAARILTRDTLCMREQRYRPRSGVSQDQHYGLFARSHLFPVEPRHVQRLRGHILVRGALVCNNKRVTCDTVTCDALRMSNFGRLAYELAYARTGGRAAPVSMDVFWHAFP